MDGLKTEMRAIVPRSAEELREDEKRLEAHRVHLGDQISAVDERSLTKETRRDFDQLRQDAADAVSQLRAVRDLIARAEEDEDERAAHLRLDEASRAVDAAKDAVSSARSALRDGEIRAVDDLVAGRKRAVSVIALRQAVEDAEGEQHIAERAHQIVNARYVAVRLAARKRRHAAAHAAYLDRVEDLPDLLNRLAGALDECTLALARERSAAPHGTNVGALHGDVDELSPHDLRYRAAKLSELITLNRSPSA
jgi:hypothetical protein